MREAELLQGELTMERDFLHTGSVDCDRRIGPSPAVDALACELLGVNRSSLYYDLSLEPLDARRPRHDLKHPFFGLMTQILKVATASDTGG